MFTVRIAELNILIENKYDFVETVCKNYIVANKPEDFSVSVSDEEIKHEKELYNSDCSDSFAESVCIYRKIAERLPPYNAFVLHAAAISFNGNAYCFAAPSGTGKTTHILNWKKRFPDEVSVINGDKPIIRIFDKKAYVCGTPWSGKEDLNSNVILPLKGICFIERASNDKITRLDSKSSLNLVLKQIYIPTKSDGLIKTIDTVANVLHSADLWQLYCTPHESSATIAKDAMTNEV